MYNNKTILTDADGVLLNWEWAFRQWMTSQGFERLPNKEFVYDLGEIYGITRAETKQFVKDFNHSYSISCLPALRDATHYVHLLNQNGYNFHVITSLTKTEEACNRRTENLKKLFGENTFSRFVYLDQGADKDEALAEYKDSGLFWIEDKIENAEAGLNAGLKPILFEHGHNMSYSNAKIPVMKNWNQIYNHIMLNS